MAYSIVFTFANPKNDLENIKGEVNIIKSLANKVDRSVITAIIDDEPGEIDIANICNYNHNIRLFHYSGHANDIGILLKEELITKAPKFSYFLNRAKKLNLVFLNGCGTEKLVNYFFVAGAKIVIATCTPIFDAKAKLFSELFYTELFNNNSIRKSFDQAKSNFEKAYPEIFDGTGVKRHIHNPNITDNLDRVDSFPWGMYFLQQFEDEQGQKAAEELAENWQLTFNGNNNAAAIAAITENNNLTIQTNNPDYDLISEIKKIVTIHIQNINIEAGNEPKNTDRDPRLNYLEEIIDSVDGAIRSRNNGIWTTGATNKVKKTILDGMPKTLKPYLDKLITSTVHISNSNNKIKILQNYLEFYKANIRTGVVISLSSLFDSFFKIKMLNPSTSYLIFDHLNKNIKKKIIELMDGLFSINGNDQFPYLNEIETAISIIRNIALFLHDADQYFKQSKPIPDTISSNQIEPFESFVKEYYKIMPKTELEIIRLNAIHSEINYIIKHFESIKEQSTVSDIENYLYNVKKNVIGILADTSYISLYKILTIGKVEVQRKKFLRNDPEYKHQIIVDDDELDDKIKTSVKFLEYFSVILVKHNRDYLNCLDLSPFIINLSVIYDMDTYLFIYLEKITGFEIIYNYFDEENYNITPAKIFLTRDETQINIFSREPPPMLGNFLNNINERTEGQPKFRLQKIRDQVNALGKLYLDIKTDLKS